MSAKVADSMNTAKQNLMVELNLFLNSNFSKLKSQVFDFIDKNYEDCRLESPTLQVFHEDIDSFIPAKFSFYRGKTQPKLQKERSIKSTLEEFLRAEAKNFK